MRTQRRKRILRDGGTAVVEYMVLLGGLIGILLSTHPPFALRLAKPMCTFALSLDSGTMPDGHLCKDTDYWLSFGISPPEDLTGDGLPPNNCPYLGEEGKQSSKQTSSGLGIQASEIACLPSNLHGSGGATGAGGGSTQGENMGSLTNG